MIEEQGSDEEETVDNSEFIDLEEEEIQETSQASLASQINEYFQTLRHRYQSMIPVDVRKLLNRGAKVGKDHLR